MPKILRDFELRGSPAKQKTDEEPNGGTSTKKVIDGSLEGYDPVGAYG